VTAFALFLGAAAVLYTLNSLLGVVSQPGDEGTTIAAVVTLALSGLYLAVAVGLWQLKNWARIAVIVLLGLNMLLLIGLLFSGLFPAVIGLVIGGYCVYWFAAHGEYFKPVSAQRNLL
jgi:hypothetical protein